MIAGALFILWRLLRNVDLDKVVAAMLATPPHAVLAACLFVAAGYVTLTFYDYFALRTIGRHDVPYRTAAFASFTSYTIGHNLGATVFTGGLVRLRIYSAWGLGIVDVAEDRLRDRADVLARQHRRARHCAGLCARCRGRRDAAAGLDQPLARHRPRSSTIAAYVVWLLPRSASDRPRQLADHPAGCAPDVRADRHRHPRFRGRIAGVLHADAGHAVDGFRRGGGRVRLGDAARLHQPRARQSRHLRRDHAARPAAVPDGGAAGVAADLPRPVFRRAVRGRRADARRARAVAGADAIPAAPTMPRVRRTCTLLSFARHRRLPMLRRQRG